ncbi:type II secretion system F family protein [Effusibacillus consociatus]|uniref:Type II secretion system F family protein n=1 Tax=Effusibacillus consociatus TaxID=1117041 RepID=A0ABV9PZN5_9BACL
MKPEESESWKDQFQNLPCRLLPKQYLQWIESQMDAAGRPNEETVSSFCSRQFLMFLLLGTLGLILPVQGGMFAPFFFAATGFCFPLFKIRGHIQRRQREVRKQVRQGIAVLIPLLESGLHFQTTLLDVLRRAEGTLGTESQILLVQIQAGRPFREALFESARRLQVREMNQWVRVLVDGDRYGPEAMAEKLRNLKGYMDRDYQRRAKKEIKDVLVRLFFVVLLFIFVPILILGFVVMLESLKQNLPM